MNMNKNLAQNQKNFKKFIIKEKESSIDIVIAPTLFVDLAVVSFEPASIDQ